MKYFIFLTYEGSTYCKKTNNDHWETANNLQMIGIAQGSNSDEAFLSLMSENEWVFDFDYDEVFCYQMADNYEKSKKNFSISEYKKSY
ncbi:MAG: hypothetical protein QMC67_13670 [Candidatus Wallbacteria bacterium]